MSVRNIFSNGTALWAAPFLLMDCLSVCLSVCVKTILSPVIGQRGWVWLSALWLVDAVESGYTPLHLTCVHRVYSWRLGWSTSVRWGSTLSIETFAIFNSTVLPNIWSDQSGCTSLNKNTATHSNLLRFKNVSATCIMCTTECIDVQRGLKFKCTWSKQSV